MSRSFQLPVREMITVADPGFPVGGVDLVGGGAWTPEVVTFQKFCTSKQENLDPCVCVWGGGGGLDPPMD